MATLVWDDNINLVQINEENKLMVFSILGETVANLASKCEIDERFYEYSKHAAPMLKPFIANNADDQVDTMIFVINCFLPYEESRNSYLPGLKLTISGEEIEIESASEYFLITRAYTLRDFGECPEHWLKLESHEFVGIKKKLFNRLWPNIESGVKRLLNKSSKK